MTLRQYQENLQGDVFTQWNAGHRNVMLVLPTGGGKTVIVSDTVYKMARPTAVIAHRQELVGQLSLALARQGIEHDVICPDNTRKTIDRLHLRELGRRFLRKGSDVRVVGVDTLVSKSRATDFAADPWFRRVALWVIDEGHHVQADNKWGAAVQMFPADALGLMVTATPKRADGRGLGRHNTGLADVLVIGPGQRDLINMGFLCPYRIITLPSDIDYSQFQISKVTGDLNQDQLRKAVHASKLIVGDVVKHYLAFAAGKRGITFTVDVQSAADTAAAYRAAGISAECVSAKTPDDVRANILQRFRNGEILQLCNCDLFGEGFDVPAVEVVTMVRRTESLALYMQQYGRSLRIMDGKTRAIVIDHVGNWKRHGPPDKPRPWSLEPATRRSGAGDDAPAYIQCLNSTCMAPYEAHLIACPFCGWQPEKSGTPVHGAGPVQVLGDLAEVDPAEIDSLLGEIARIDGTPQIPHGLPDIAAAGARKQWLIRQTAQSALRTEMGLFGGVLRAEGRVDREIQRAFFLAFGVDVLTAQTLKTADAETLRGRVSEWLTGRGIDRSSSAV